MGVKTTGRQRDFLASYPSEAVIELIAAADGALIAVCDSGDLDEGVERLVVPPEGFLTQPEVELHDHDAWVDRIPTALWTPEQIEEHRDDTLRMLPDEVESAFWDLMNVASSYGFNADWDAVLDALRRGVPGESSDEEEVAEG